LKISIISLLLLLPCLLQAQELRIGFHTLGMPIKPLHKLDNSTGSHPTFKFSQMPYFAYGDIFIEYRQKSWAICFTHGNPNTGYTAQVNGRYRGDKVDKFLIRHGTPTLNSEQALLFKKNIGKHFYGIGGLVHGTLRVGFAREYEGDIYTGHPLDPQRDLVTLLGKKTILRHTNSGVKIGFGYRHKLYRKWDFEAQFLFYGAMYDLTHRDYFYSVNGVKYHNWVTSKGSYVALQLGISYALPYQIWLKKLKIKK